MQRLQIWLLVACALCINRIPANPIIDPKADVATEFIILHNNDMHARFEQTSVNGDKCRAEDANSNKCYGGFARVAYEVRKYREEAQKGGMPAIYLNAGDTYTGTSWFAIFKDNITAAFLNKLQPDAISLGNHELDENVAGLVPFLNAVDFPVLACNLDLTNTPEITATKSFAHSTVLTVNGVKVGVIGYLTPETKILTGANTVEYKPEIESINAEAAIMKADGVNIIIALGHSGYQKDQEIAEKCPEVDIVVGGHSHTFLWSDAVRPDAEYAAGPYPTTVKQPSGKMVPVVQAYAYTKYLGKLHAQFDKDGNLIEFDGTPILLNAEIPAEDDVLQLLEVYRPNITALEDRIVGYTKVHLEGRSQVCRREECNLGNLIADTMIYARVLENQGGLYWTDAPIAFINGGSIRGSISKPSDGSITADDVVTVLPYESTLHVTRISGKTLHQALEYSATVRSRDSNGGFLQMSGVRAVYDYNEKEGERVTSVEVRCAECDVPDYEALDLTKMYNVIVTSFLLNEGDGHVFVEPGNAVTYLLEKNDQDAFISYLDQRDYIYPDVEGRLTIIAERVGDTGVGLVSSMVSIIAALIFMRVMY